ncbi:MAG: head GIN domain-containing protein [Pyrinomonadaceae bacterium]
MRKIGFLVFIVALILGVTVAGFFSWGKASAKFFNVTWEIGGERGSGNVQTETRDIKGFKSVDVSGVFQVEIVAQKDFGVQVEADENLLQYITTEVNGGVLEISTSKRIKSSSGLKLRISAPDVERLEVSGVAKVYVSDLKNAGLQLDTSGASKVNLAGETDKLTVDVSGASQIDAENLKTRAATVDASGASKVSVFATESIRSEASGASRVTYTGGATDVVKKTSGASSVSQK